MNLYILIFKGHINLYLSYIVEQWEDGSNAVVNGKPHPYTAGVYWGPLPSHSWNYTYLRKSTT